MAEASGSLRGSTRCVALAHRTTPTSRSFAWMDLPWSRRCIGFLHRTFGIWAGSSVGICWLLLVSLFCFSQCFFVQFQGLGFYPGPIHPIFDKVYRFTISCFFSVPMALNHWLQSLRDRSLAQPALSCYLLDLLAASYVVRRGRCLLWSGASCTLPESYRFDDTTDAACPKKNTSAVTTLQPSNIRAENISQQAARTCKSLFPLVFYTVQWYLSCIYSTGVLNLCCALRRLAHLSPFGTFLLGDLLSNSQQERFNL